MWSTRPGREAGGQITSFLRPHFIPFCCPCVCVRVLDVMYLFCMKRDVPWLGLFSEVTGVATERVRILNKEVRWTHDDREDRCTKEIDV